MAQVTFPKMDPWIKKKWVAALRSGVYRQATGKLREPNKPVEEAGHCCLGVLADVAAPEGWQSPSFNGVRYGGLTGSLPGPLLTRVGLTPDVEQALIRQNDEGYITPKPHGTYRKKRPGRTFQQIADWVEKNL